MNKSLTVGVDARVLADQIHSGVQEYAIGLIRQLISDKPARVRLKFFIRASRDASWQQALSRIPSGEKIYRSRLPSKIFDVSAIILAGPRIDKMLQGVDVIVSPHFLLTPLSPDVPRIIVVHDLSFFHFPEFFPVRSKLWHARLLIRSQFSRAKHIIAVSRATRMDVVRSYNVPAKKITTVYPGLSPLFNKKTPADGSSKKIAKRYTLPSKFILFLGTLEPRKNVIGLVRGFELFNKNFPGLAQRYSLVIAGQTGWLYQPLINAVASSRCKDRIQFLGFIPETDKPVLYRLASAFVYPSFFEGFGFPVLEAMSQGVPVITSRLSSLPEVVGNNALLIDPHRPEEIALALAQLLGSRELINELGSGGIRQAQKFRWNKTTQAIYHKILPRII